MWMVTDTTQGVGLEWWTQPRAPTDKPVVLVSPGMSFTTAELIKKQFDNMGITPMKNPS